MIVFVLFYSKEAVMKEERIVEKNNGELRTTIVRYNDVQIDDYAEKYDLSLRIKHSIGGLIKKLIDAKGSDKEERINKILLDDKIYEGSEFVVTLGNDNMVDYVNKLLSYYNMYPDYVSNLIKVRVISTGITRLMKNLNNSNKDFYDYLNNDVIETKILFEKFNSELVISLKKKGLYEFGLAVFEDILSNHINYNITALKSGRYSSDGKPVHLCYECNYAYKCAKVSAPDWSVRAGYLTSKGMMYYDEILSGVERINGDNIECQFISSCKNYCFVNIHPKIIDRLANEKLEEEEMRAELRREKIKELKEERARLKEMEKYSKIIEVSSNVTIKILKPNSK